MHLVWHRTELRTHDHPALDAAARSGEAVLPLVVIDPVIFARPTTTPRRRAWFLENVRALCGVVPGPGLGPGRARGRPARGPRPTGPRGRGHARPLHPNHTPYAKVRATGPPTAPCSRRAWRSARYPGQYTRPARRGPHRHGHPLLRLRPVRTQMALPAAAGAGPDPRPTTSVPRRIARGVIPVARSDVPLPDPGEGAALARLEAFLRDGEADYATAGTSRPGGPGTSLLSMYFNIGGSAPAWPSAGRRRQVAVRAGLVGLQRRGPRPPARGGDPGVQGRLARLPLAARRRRRSGAGKAG